MSESVSLFVCECVTQKMSQKSVFYHKQKKLRFLSGDIMNLDLENFFDFLAATCSYVIPTFRPFVSE